MKPAETYTHTHTHTHTNKALPGIFLYLINNLLFCDVGYAAIKHKYCDPGTYINIGNTDGMCSSCTDSWFRTVYAGFACPGGEIEYETVDADGRTMAAAGLEYCGEINYVPSKDRTKCEPGNSSDSEIITCQPGEMVVSEYDECEIIQGDGFTINECKNRSTGWEIDKKITVSCQKCTPEVVNRALNIYYLWDYKSAQNLYNLDWQYYYCGGGPFVVPKKEGYYKGLTKCPDGRKVICWYDTTEKKNKCNYAECGDKSDGCDEAGYYFDIHTEKCVKCTTDNVGEYQYCLWGSVRKCPEGIKANADHTSCEEKTSTTSAIAQLCDAGYINVNGQCVSCTSNPEWVKFAKESRMYCPGGGTSGAMWNTQLKKCPKYKKPNDNLDDCECIYDDVKSDCKPKSLSHKEIYYGPLGKDGADALYKQCWTKKTKSAYRKCMGFDD